MSSILSSDELAEDYKSSLEDLSFNSRYEISNLTVIARENVAAAQAIARTLETHIQNTAPSRKLPALYLLDSIVKNVGTPYTLFFQRNLYSTFMNAYLVVDPPIRRKLEEMLQTWKQPVPGSVSTAPVFGQEVTRKIDNALIKARTAALEQQQKQKRNQQNLGLDSRPPTRTPPPQQFRNTPPIPQPNGNVPYANGNANAFDYGRSATGTPVGQSGTPPTVDNGLRQLSIQPQPQPAGGNGNVDTLQSDIFRLIDSCQIALAREPLNQEIQKRLQALVDLRNILQTQQLPEAQLVLIRDQVRALANPTPPPMVVAPPPPPVPPPQPPQMPLPLSTQDLASLLATVPFPPNVSQQTQRPLAMPLPTAPIIPAPPPAPMGNTNFGGNAMDPAALFASLQKAGLLPPPPPPPPAGGPLPFPLPLLPRNIMTPPTQSATPVANAATPGNKWDWRSIDVEMKSLSLKIPRPHLIPRLSETLPIQCSSCARRFEDSEKGRNEKRAHLDWHFRVHQRMAESVKRGQNRSWYVDEEEWIKTIDDAEDILPASHTANNIPAPTQAAQQAELKKQYVVVPDASETYRVCPICQEELKYVWHDETDEFVWMDAKQVGGRIYHASCHAEASKDRANAPTTTIAAPTGNGSRGGTPDSAQGVKRKIEDEDASERKVKIKTEPI